VVFDGISLVLGDAIVYRVQLRPRTHSSARPEMKKIQNLPSQSQVCKLDASKFVWSLHAFVPREPFQFQSPNFIPTSKPNALFVSRIPRSHRKMYPVSLHDTKSSFSSKHIDSRVSESLTSFQLYLRHGFPTNLDHAARASSALSNPPASPDSDQRAALS
jgi:hypothetical protein